MPPSPTPSDATIDVCANRMDGLPPLFGYEYYDHTCFAHSQYRFDVPQEDGSMKTPHYINFQFDASYHPYHLPAHTVSVQCEEAGLDYGQPLHAKPSLMTPFLSLVSTTMTASL